MLLHWIAALLVDATTLRETSFCCGLWSGGIYGVALRRYTRRSNPAIRASIADGELVRWLSEAAGRVRC
jgi:hypothetical protein